MRTLELADPLYARSVSWHFLNSRRICEKSTTISRSISTGRGGQLPTEHRTDQRVFRYTPAVYSLVGRCCTTRPDHLLRAANTSSAHVLTDRQPAQYHMSSRVQREPSVQSCCACFLPAPEANRPFFPLQRDSPESDWWGIRILWKHANFRDECDLREYSASNREHWSNDYAEEDAADKWACRSTAIDEIIAEWGDTASFAVDKNWEEVGARLECLCELDCN